MSKTHLTSGIHSVHELLKNNPETIDYCIILSTKPNNRLTACIELIKNNNIEIQQFAPKNILNQVEGINHQNIIAIHKTAFTTDLFSFVKNKGDALKLVILDGVQDPRNLGSCIRTACANNCDAIIVSKNKSPPINETVTKVACGACAILPIFQVSNISQTIDKLKKSGVWCWGFSEHATSSLYEASFSGPCALIFGTEDKGIRQLTKQKCDFLVKIPTNKNFPSLNLAVSVGIATFVLNQQKN